MGRRYHSMPDEVAAAHEAGHALSDTVYDIRLDFVDLNAAHFFRGVADEATLGAMPANVSLAYGERYVRGQAVSALAGSAAQRLLYPGWPRWCSISKADESIATRHIRILAPTPRGQRSLRIALEEEARTLCERDVDILRSLAAALLERKRLSGDEVLSVIAEARERRALELGPPLPPLTDAEIKAGYAWAASRREAEKRTPRTIGRRHAAEAALRYVTAKGIDPAEVAYYAGYFADGRAHDATAVEAKLDAIRAAQPSSEPLTAQTEESARPTAEVFHLSSQRAARRLAP